MKIELPTSGDVHKLVNDLEKKYEHCEAHVNGQWVKITYSKLRR